MWGVSTAIIAFAIALMAMSFAFAGGAVIVAIPLALLMIAGAAALDFSRRRKQARELHHLRDEAKAEKVDFTDRDKETLVSE